MSKVGICLLNWQGLRYTAACILSLIEQDYNDIKIYVLDQGSTDGSLQWLKKLAATNAIDLTDAGKNVGFSTGNNILIEKALKDMCDYVLIFNNDTRAFPNMVSTMLKCFKDNKDCGACGVPAYEYDHGLNNWKDAKRLWGIGGWVRLDNSMVQVDGFGIGWVDNHIRECQKCKAKLPLNMNEASNVKCPNCGWHPYDEKYCFCHYVGGGCMMISRKVIEEVGLFDTAYDPLYHEDVDYCIRVLQKGYKVIHINKSGFNHAVSAFSSGYKRQEFWKIHVRNQKYFMEKWKKELENDLHFE